MRNLVLLGLLAAGTASATAQFELQSSGTTASLRGIHALGNGIAWASGTEGTVLRTTDDGQHWQHCPTPPDAEKLDFRAVQALDANTAIVMSSGTGTLSRLYKTRDACHSWKLVLTNPDPEGFWDALSLDLTPLTSTPPTHAGKPTNRSKDIQGTLLGDPVHGHFPIFQTTDSGDTWTPRTPQKRGPKGEGCQRDDFPAKQGEAAFAASNQSLVGGNYFIFVTGGADSRLAFNKIFSLDGAHCHESSEFLSLPITHTAASTGAFAMAAQWIKGRAGNFPDTIVIVGGDYTKPDATEGNAAWITHFGSPLRTIAKPATPPHGYRSSVAYDPTSKTWITTGPNGTDLSTDNGKNWHPLKPSPSESPDADRNWNALSLPFAVGPKGRIGKLNPNPFTH